MKLELFYDRNGKPRLRLVGWNGEIVMSALWMKLKSILSSPSATDMSGEKEGGK